MEKTLDTSIAWSALGSGSAVDSRRAGGGGTLRLRNAHHRVGVVALMFGAVLAVTGLTEACLIYSTLGIDTR